MIKKIFVLALGLSLGGINGVVALEQNPALPNKNLQNFDGYQDIYLKLHENAVVTEDKERDRKEIYKRVGQNPFTFPPYVIANIKEASRAQKFKKMEELAENLTKAKPEIQWIERSKNSKGEDQVTLTLPLNLFIEEDEVIGKLCRLEALGSGSDDILNEGISYEYLFNTQSQAAFTGQVKKLCDQERYFLQKERNAITKNELKALFIKGPESKSPQSATNDASSRQAVLSQESVAGKESNPEVFGKGYNADGTANEGGLRRYGEADAFSQSEIFLDANTGPNNTATNRELKPGNGGTVDLLSGVPFAENILDKIPFAAELSAAFGGEEEGESEEGPQGFLSTGNEASFDGEDISVVGNLNAIKTYLAEVNSYPLLGQCATHYFGEVPFLDWKGDGKSFLQHDPYPMHVIYEVPMSEEEGVDEAIEANGETYTDQYSSAYTFALYREKCENKVFGDDTDAAAINISECKAEEEARQQRFLDRLQKTNLVRSEAQSAIQTFQRSEQENADLSALLFGMKQIRITLEALSKKPRKQ